MNSELLLYAIGDVDEELLLRSEEPGSVHFPASNGHKHFSLLRFAALPAAAIFIAVMAFLPSIYSHFTVTDPPAKLDFKTYSQGFYVDVPDDPNTQVSLSWNGDGIANTDEIIQVCLYDMDLQTRQEITQQFLRQEELAIDHSGYYLVYAVNRQEEIMDLSDYLTVSYSILATPNCQNATALAAATFRESTPWDMGIRTV